MSNGFSTEIALPDEVAVRLNQWRRLWFQSALLHYVFGVGGVLASSLAAAEFVTGYSRVLAAVAAACVAVLGFMQPDRRYQKFVRAWRALDPIVLRYKYGKATLDDVFAALERGESIISEYEQEIARQPTTGQTGGGKIAGPPTP
jgi:hypothetical protein